MSICTERAGTAQNITLAPHLWVKKHLADGHLTGTLSGWLSYDPHHLVDSRVSCDTVTKCRSAKRFLTNRRGTAMTTIMTIFCLTN